MLNNLMTKEDYQASREGIFPTKWAFQWYLRKHKTALAKAGALLHISRYLINPEAFDKFVLSQGAIEATEMTHDEDDDYGIETPNA